MIFINEYDLINEYQGKPYGIHRLCILLIRALVTDSIPQVLAIDKNLLK